jgi:integrase
VIEEERKRIDQLLVNNLKIRLACRLLFDLAARSQDLTDLTFNSFKEVQGGAANVCWKPRKQMKANVLRKCFVTPETMALVKEYQGNRPLSDRLYPHSDAVMNSIMHRAFKSIGVDAKSHGFRHAKLTDLGTFLTPHQVRDYAGHSSIKITDAYLHSNQEEVLRRVADAWKDPGEARETLLPQKRAAKATKKFDARTALQAQKEAPEKTDKNETKTSPHSIKPSGEHDRQPRRSERTKKDV